MDAAEQIAVNIRRCRRLPRPKLRSRPARRCCRKKCRPTCAWTGTPATRTRSMRRSRGRRMSSRCRSTIIASSPIRWNRAARSALTTRGGSPYAACVQPEHARQSRRHRALVGCSAAPVRFVAPDVGGGFGAKNFTYAEHALLLWAAKRVGRPVKWIATRSEVFFADHQARDHVAEAALALDNDGRFLALRVASMANIGAYMAGGAAACRPTSTCICPAASMRFRRSRCTSHGAVQHNADRRDARSGIRRGGQHHRAPDRRGGAAMRLRSRRTAPRQHGAGRRR